MQVVILSHETDLHAQAVARELKILGATCRIWDLACILEQEKSNIHLGGTPPLTLSCELKALSGGQLDLMKVDSIWLRRPGKPRAQKMPEKWIESVASWESELSLKGLWRLLPCFWVNNPANQEEAMYKVRQLGLAMKVGLNVPETVITNDPAKAEEFYNKHQGRLIYKLVDERSKRFFPPSEAYGGLPTMIFRRSDLAHAEQIAFSMHLFQEMIDKQYDIRATIIGDKIFSLKIESQKGLGKQDWRLDYSVPMSLCELPDEISGKCLQLMKELGLVFGCFDLCVDKEGRYFFFEVNPAGQFLFAEERLGIPLSLELARFLTVQE